MSEEILAPPPLYELVVAEKTDSARAHAERLAIQGAEEGTLVWAKSQTNGLGRNQRFWISGYKNLHLALVLKPDQPWDVACQLSLVSTICAGLAISEQAEPMVELRYRWPNDVLLNLGKVGGITLSGSLGKNTVPEWMVIGLNVNVYEHPTSLGFESASMRGEGFESYDRIKLAEAFCRHFLSWINRWDKDGFGPVRKAWLTRGEGDPLRQIIRLEDAEITGVFDHIDEYGTLALQTDNQGMREITLLEFFHPDFIKA